MKYVILILLIVLAVMKGYAIDPAEPVKIPEYQILNDHSSVLINFLEENRSQVPSIPLTLIHQVESDKTGNIYLLREIFFIYSQNVLNELNKIIAEMEYLLNLDYREACNNNNSVGIRSYKLRNKKPNETRKIVLFQ